MEEAQAPCHVYPTDEEHNHDFVGCRCRCIPQVWLDADGTVMVTHNSFDGRERSESGYVRLN